jgi:hypothetical protein
MDTTIKINTKDLNKIIKSNKDFFIYQLDENKSVTNYKLTNDAIRDRKIYPYLCDILSNKTELNEIKLNLKHL